MLSSLSNKKLGIVFAVLLSIVLIFFVLGGEKNERTFRDTLVEIDTSAVTAIKIYPKTTDYEEVKLFSEGNEWFVNLENGKTAKVKQDKINSLFQQLLSVKPKRLASRNKKKWNEMQVDSTGTRVVVMEGSDETLNLVIGKFSFKQPRSMSTFVRLFEDADVYEIDGFLDMSFNQKPNYFRDATVIQDDHNNWSRLSFQYPADSSFQLSKQGDYWFDNSVEVDSASTANTLRVLSRINGSDFIDSLEVSELGNPTHKLVIDSDKLGEITVDGYYVDEKNNVIVSSLNPEAIFDGIKNNLFNKVFIGRHKFDKR